MSDDAILKQYNIQKNKFIEVCKSNVPHALEIILKSYSSEFKKDPEVCHAFIKFLRRGGEAFEKRYKEGFNVLKEEYKLPNKIQDLLYSLFDKSMIQATDFTIKLRTLKYTSATNKKNRELCLFLASLNSSDVTQYMDKELLEDTALLLDIVQRAPHNIVYIKNQDERFYANAIIRNVAVVYEIKDLELLKKIYDLMRSNAKTPRNSLESIKGCIASLTSKVKSPFELKVIRDEKRIEAPSPQPKRYVNKHGAIAYAPTSSHDKIL